MATVARSRLLLLARTPRLLLRQPRRAQHAPTTRESASILSPVFYGGALAASVSLWIAQCECEQATQAPILAVELDGALAKDETSDDKTEVRSGESREAEKATEKAEAEKAGEKAEEQVSEAEAKVSTKPQRLPIGGVRQEYKKEPRGVRSLDPARSSFFSKEVQVLGVPIRSHSTVSDGALLVAADRLGRMLRHLPSQVRDRLTRRGASFHIIGVDQGTSDLPEHEHMKGVPGGYTKEGSITLDQRARGMGGLQSSCGEENLIDLDSDPRYAGQDILSHEFAHCVMDYGLPSALQEEIRQTHQRAVEAGRWRRQDGGMAYAGSNASEYFAELTMWYFGTHGEFVDRKARSPPPGPGGLADYDPDGFKLISSIYSGTHHRLCEEDTAPIRVLPLSERQLSDGAEAHLTDLEFDNRCCAAAWHLYWVNPEGGRVKYGRIDGEAMHVQQTFPGHIWLLEAVQDTDNLERREVRYMVPDGPGLAAVAEDSGCKLKNASAEAAPPHAQ